MAESNRRGSCADGPPVDRVYWSGRSLYVNLTSRCSNRCTFCVGNDGPELWGYRLRYPTAADEPSPEDVVRAVRAEGDAEELVFCGFGEPMLRVGAILDVLAQLGLPRERVRVNTNGQALLYPPADVLDRCAPAIGIFSVSLNAPDAETYVRLCRPEAGEAAFRSILAFIAAARDRFQVRATAVRVPGIDLAATAALAARLGVPFRVRG